MLTRPIPSTGQQLPILGLGTWSTFNVPKATTEIEDVLKTFHAAGGRLIDSSPMYGNAEKIVGDLTTNTPTQDDFFYATKVWTEGKEAGVKQMNASFNNMGRTTMDLMQIHNLVDWKTHLKTLREWKESGKIKYIGITHYTDSMHGELEKIILAEEIDFVQFNYSILSTNAEKRLLPAAAERGVATLINRPFSEGAAFSTVRGKQVPAWAVEHGLKTWSQFFLGYIVSHPAVTCVIPATGKAQHAKDNYDWMMNDVDEKLREKMREEIQ